MALIILYVLTIHNQDDLCLNIPVRIAFPDDDGLLINYVPSM